MRFNPTLSRTDRIGSGLFGVALLAVALFRDFDRPWARLVPVVFGVVFVINAVGGT